MASPQQQQQQLDDDADTTPPVAFSGSVTEPVERAENVVVPQRQQLLYYVLQADTSSCAGATFRKRALGPATVTMLQAAADAVKKAMSVCTESIMR
jgi:hypothetical protein